MNRATKAVPLERVHRELGGQMVPFGGYTMPLSYSSIRAEHLGVRHAAGLFDVSHMGEVRVRGLGALDYLQHLVTNDVSRMTPGRALYTVMCNPEGGIVDDLLVYRDEQDYMCVINASRHDPDLAWMEGSREGRDVEVVDVSDETALLAVQGPTAFEIVQSLVTGEDLGGIGYYHHRRGTVASIPARISRTGYTGEDGFELYVAPVDAEPLWSALMAAGEAHGLVPAGLGARDTLRLEAGLRLYGNDIDETTDPLSAGLGWVVKMGKGEFQGREALGRMGNLPGRSFIGLKLGAREIPRPGQPIYRGEVEVGGVTSGSFGFALDAGLALGYVRRDCSAPGTELRVRLHREPDRWAVAPVVPLPFYRRGES